MARVVSGPERAASRGSITPASLRFALVLCGVVYAAQAAPQPGRRLPSLGRHARQAECPLPSSFEFIGQITRFPECDSLISPITMSLRNVLSQVEAPTRPETFAELLRVLAENEAEATGGPLCDCLTVLNDAALQALFPNPACAQTGYFPDLGITVATCPVFDASTAMPYSPADCACPTIPPSPVNVTALGITASPSPPQTSSPTPAPTSPANDASKDGDGGDDVTGLALWLWVLIAIGALIAVVIVYTCYVLWRLEAEKARQDTHKLFGANAGSKTKPSNTGLGKAMESAVNPLFGSTMTGMAASLPRNTATVEDDKGSSNANTTEQEQEEEAFGFPE